MADEKKPIAPEGRTKGADVGPLETSPGKSHPMTEGKTAEDQKGTVRTTQTRGVPARSAERVADQAEEMRRLQDAERTGGSPDE